MPALRLSQDIRPVTDLKAHGAEIVRQVGETHRPVVLSRHGRAVAVVRYVEEYGGLQDAAGRAELQAAVEEAEGEIAGGRSIPGDVVKRQLKTWADGGA